MSRLSRADAAKSVIAMWRWLNEQAVDSKIEGNINDLLARLPKEGVGGVAGPDASVAMGDRIKLMAHLNLLKQDMRHEWIEDSKAPHGGRPGVRTTTTLLEKNVESGMRTIGKHFAQGGFLKVSAVGNQKRGLSPDLSKEKKVDPNVVAIRTDEKDRPVEAVVGEDAPSPFAALRALRQPSEPEAFIEAARQYDNRQDYVVQQLEQMERLGIKIDRALVMKGIDLERNDEFEGVLKVLPYIDELQAKVAQMQDWREQVISVRNELRTMRRERDEALLEATRQREANKRIVEERVKQSTSTVLVGN